MDSALFPFIVAVIFVSFPQIFSSKKPNIICVFNVVLWGYRNFF